MKLENPIYESDPYLSDFKPELDRRHEKMAKTISSIEGKRATQFYHGPLFRTYSENSGKLLKF